MIVRGVDGRLYEIVNKKKRNPKKTLQHRFDREKRVFSRKFPNISKSKLIILKEEFTPGSPGTFRDVAMADLSTNTVYIVKRAEKLPVHNQIAIIRHELGHLADPTPSAPGAELRADAIAAAVTGQPINYDHNDMQTTRPGHPRPGYLHQ